MAWGRRGSAGSGWLRPASGPWAPTLRGAQHQVGGRRAVGHRKRTQAEAAELKTHVSGPTHRGPSGGTREGGWVARSLSGLGAHTRAGGGKSALSEAGTSPASWHAAPKGRWGRGLTPNPARPWNAGSQVPRYSRGQQDKLHAPSSPNTSGLHRAHSHSKSCVTSPVWPGQGRALPRPPSLSQATTSLRH